MVRIGGVHGGKGPARRLVWPVVMAAALVAGFADSSPAPRVKSLCQPVDECSDPRGCPDFVVDYGFLADPDRTRLETWTYEPDNCAVIEGEVLAGKRELVVFHTVISNFGPGAIALGNPFDHPEWFDLETCHGHPHIKEYADYRLWTVAGYQQWRSTREAEPTACAVDIFSDFPELEAQLVRGAKRGFCLIDLDPHPLLSGIPCPAPAPDPRTYPTCDFSGLSVCWSDAYNWVPNFIDGNSIDVLELPDGDYVLENEANARHFFTEGNYLNNSAAVKIRLSHRGGGRGRRILEILGPP